MKFQTYRTRYTFFESIKHKKKMIVNDNKTPKTPKNNPQYTSKTFDLFQFYAQENWSPRVRDFQPEYLTLFRTLYLYSKSQNPDQKPLVDFAITFCDGLSLRPQIITSLHHYIIQRSSKSNPFRSPRLCHHLLHSNKTFIKR